MYNVITFHGWKQTNPLVGMICANVLQTQARLEKRDSHYDLHKYASDTGTTEHTFENHCQLAYVHNFSNASTQAQLKLCNI